MQSGLQPRDALEVLEVAAGSELQRRGKGLEQLLEGVGGC
jgi:hypothetical protein